MERLQKVIAQSGLCSRRKAEEYIINGVVRVNGNIVRELGTKVSRKDDITVNGKPIQKEELVYYVLYKPVGYVSTTKDEKGRKTVLDFLPTGKRVYPVGRLDYDTSGVLLLTNDGEFTNQMISPKHHVEKEYMVKMKGFLRKNESHMLAKGITLDGVKTKPAVIRNVVYSKNSETCTANIIITEGKYHQVKRMFAAVGHPVIKLKRVRFGVVTLKGMSPGDVRLLKPHERKHLLRQGK